MMRSTGPAVDAWNGVDAPRPVASWYTEGLSDGVGDRLLMFDNSDHASLELLRFRPELVAADGFEEALRSRVADLQSFAHPSFPHIRAVEQLDGGGLALVSTFTPGKRLSEVFANQRARAGIHPTFAAWLVRDLTSALADLQRHSDTVAHAALTPNRILVGPDGRVRIVEHVLGTALERLRWTPHRHWLNLGLLAPENGGGAACLDRRTDVIQIGWIVLSALVGRRATSAEYPGRAQALVDEFVRLAGPRSPGLVAALQRWFERALQLSDDGFASAIDAHRALTDLRVTSGPDALPSMAQPNAAAPLAHQAPRELPPAIDVVPQIDLPPIDSTEEIALSSDVEMSPMTAADAIATLRARHRMDAPEVRRLDGRAMNLAKLGWIVAGALAMLSLAEGAALGRLYVARAAVLPPIAAPIVFGSLSPGDAVIVNGKQVGVTPFTLTLTPEIHSVSVHPKAALTSIDVTAAPAPVSDTESATALALADARSRRGGLRLISPIDVQVLEGERVLGSSADGPIVATAGSHELDFINPAVGYRWRQTVSIKAGQILKMNIAMPDGRVSVNAVPWAQVSIDGTAVGDTPLANLPLAVGEHQITFRHPQLGEQTQRVVVKTGTLTRVSATLTR